MKERVRRWWATLFQVDFGRAQTQFHLQRENIDQPAAIHHARQRRSTYRCDAINGYDNGALRNWMAQITIQLGHIIHRLPFFFLSLFGGEVGVFEIRANRSLQTHVHVSVHHSLFGKKQDGVCVCVEGVSYRSNSLCLRGRDRMSCRKQQDVSRRRAQ